MHKQPSLDSLMSWCGPITALALALPAVACSDDPVTYSAPVGISLKLASGDVEPDDTFLIDKNINTESGNPYGVFISDARDALGGSDPARLELDDLTLTLLDTSDGVAGLGEALVGDVEVQFEFSSSVITVAHHTFVPADGAGPVAFDIDFNDVDFTEAEYDELLGGGFKAGLTGSAVAGFAAASADADLELTFTFSAFEE